MRRTRDPIERFEEKYIPEPNTGCWLWVGALGTGAGYPKFWDGVQIRDGHRWAYEAFKGDPHGYVVKHECDTPSCVNPDHLSLGTQTSNLQDMYKRGRSRGQKQTHCKHGHEFTEANIRYELNKYGTHVRRCRECARINGRIQKRKARA